jgi:hypothetical protein
MEQGKESRAEPRVVASQIDAVQDEIAALRDELRDLTQRLYSAEGEGTPSRKPV